MRNQPGNASSTPPMIELTFHLARAEGDMEVFVVRPAGTGALPAVILYMDMWGLRATLLDIARDVAAAGYHCVLPDLYYRRGKVRYAARDIPGLKLAFADLEPERQIALRAAMDGLSDAMVIEDTAALLDALSRDALVRHGPLGAIGYCMGGRHALCVAGTFPQRFKAAACLHGAGLISADDNSPHLLARCADGELYCGHAERDRYAPPDVVERLEQALSGCRVRHHWHVHAGAEHGYAMPDRNVFNQKATEQDWETILAMLERQLLREAA
jgi:carboxymethylenebutenolidase